ncbi:MAG: putative porin [Thermoanaerobaculia bacterium]
MEGSERRRFSGRCGLTLATLAIAAILSAQEPQYFEAPAEKPRLVFAWDALFRYDNISHLRVRPDIERGRFEFRPELDLVFSDRLRIGVRAVGDYGTDTNADNLINFDNYQSRGVLLDRLYLEAKPGPVILFVGKFGMPLVSSEMLWDKDIQTPGAAAAWEIPAGSSRVTLAAAGFVSPQLDTDHTRIVVGQAVWRWGDAARLALEAAAAYWHYDVRDLDPGYLRQNYKKLVNGQLVYFSNYDLADLFLRARFSLGQVPVTLTLDGIHNFGSPTDEVNAAEATFALGRVGAPGQWRFFYTFQWVETEALPGAYNTDDWWFHTWARGHRIGAAITVLPSVFVQGAVVFQQRLDLNTWLNRVTVDLVKMF